MAGFKVEVHIKATPDVVFERAGDPRRWAESISGITKVEVVSDGPIGVGTRFRETRIMFGREATEEMEFTSYDPPHGFTLDCQSCGCRFQSVHTFTANGTGTDAELKFEALPLTFVARVIGFLMRPMFKMMVKGCTKDLESLRQSIEGQAVTAVK